MLKEILCNKCNKVKKVKKATKINGSIFCPECMIEKRKEHRDFLKHEILGIKRRCDLEKEWANKRKEKANAPVICVAKPKFYFSISGVERQILFKKYLKSGLSYEESDRKVKCTCNYLQDLMAELRLKIKDTKELNIRFKEEFAKLLR
jgi:hypothetical protein